MVASLYYQMISSLADKSKIPLFTELVLYLNPYRNQIDKDIRKNPSSFEALEGRPGQEPRYKNFPARGYSENSRNRVRVNNLNRTSLNSRSEGVVNNKFINSLHCFLCGQSPHPSKQKLELKSSKTLLLPSRSGVLKVEISPAIVVLYKG